MMCQGDFWHVFLCRAKEQDISYQKMPYLFIQKHDHVRVYPELGHDLQNQGFGVLHAQKQHQGHQKHTGQLSLDLTKQL